MRHFANKSDHRTARQSRVGVERHDIAHARWQSRLAIAKIGVRRAPQQTV